MKSEKSLSNSVKAFIKQAGQSAQLVQERIDELKGGASPEKVMPSLRYHLETLNKAVHEYNAYRNALETD